MQKLRIGPLKARIALAAGVVLLCVTACSRLADVKGTWSTTPTRIDAPQVASATASGNGPSVNITTQVATQITFIPDINHSGSGAVEFVSDIDAINSVPFEGQVVDPYEVSIAATAVCSGSYHFDDRDEIIVAIDPSSIRVTVDPDGVNYSENVLTGSQAPQIDSLRPALVERYTRMLTPIVSDYYSKFSKIDDIKVKNDIMSCEINHRDYTFRRAR